jgi:hypothetical protein
MNKKSSLYIANDTYNPHKSQKKKEVKYLQKKYPLLR